MPDTAYNIYVFDPDPETGELPEEGNITTNDVSLDVAATTMSLLHDAVVSKGAEVTDLRTRDDVKVGFIVDFTYRVDAAWPRRYRVAQVIEDTPASFSQTSMEDI